MLKLDTDGHYRGNEYNISRLASLLGFCVKWYFFIAIASCFVLITAGYLYFNKYGGDYKDIDWIWPWILICIGTAFKLFQSPLTSILSGLGYIKEMSEVGFYQQICSPIVLCTGLACGLKLYVVGISYVLTVILWFFYVRKKNLAQLLYNLWKVNVTDRVSYFKEIFPYQWRIAISWISGFFVFHLFNPILFAVEGPIVAGQMGLTMQVLGIVQTLSMSWITTKVPTLSRMIALKDYIPLDVLFNRTLKQMGLVCVVMLFAFVLSVWFISFVGLEYHDELISERFLPLIPMILMSLSIFAFIFINSWATYLRCHKKEPFLIFSVVNAGLDAVVMFILAKIWGVVGLAAGYCAITVCMVPWAYMIFYKCKTKWHE